MARADFEPIVGEQYQHAANSVASVVEPILERFVDLLGGTDAGPVVTGAIQAVLCVAMASPVATDAETRAALIRTIDSLIPRVRAALARPEAVVGRA